MTDLPPFSVTYDYRCPLARNVHEHLIAGLRAGADWDVTFLPFSLNQVHVDEGGIAGVGGPGRRRRAAAGARFAGRARRVPRPVPRRFTRRCSPRATTSTATCETAPSSPTSLPQRRPRRRRGAPQRRRGRRRIEAVPRHPQDVGRDHKVFGVPTFIVGDAAVFVRLMHRPEGDAKEAIASIERVVDLTEWSDLNEFKWTSVRR